MTHKKPTRFSLLHTFPMSPTPWRENLARTFILSSSLEPFSFAKYIRTHPHIFVPIPPQVPNTTFLVKYYLSFWYFLLICVRVRERAYLCLCFYVNFVIYVLCILWMFQYDVMVLCEEICSLICRAIYSFMTVQTNFLSLIRAK